ncbi:MAG: hypothetical protein ACREI2_14300 [Nitrospiraceae bacterium]
MDLDLSVDQSGRVTAPFEVVVRFELVQIHVGNKKGDNRDGKNGQGGVISPFGSGAMGF